MDPGAGLGADLVSQLCRHTHFSCFYLTSVSWYNHFFFFLTSNASLAQFTEMFSSLQPLSSPRSVIQTLSSFLLSTSAIMGHCLHCLRGYHSGVSMLLLHLQKMDIQEEKQKEGQRQGQECNQHDGRQRWSQNGGKNFELSLLQMQKHIPPCTR